MKIYHLSCQSVQSSVHTGPEESLVTQVDPASFVDFGVNVSPPSLKIDDNTQFRPGVFCISTERISMISVFDGGLVSAYISSLADITGMP